MSERTKKKETDIEKSVKEDWGQKKDKRNRNTIKKYG